MTRAGLIEALWRPDLPAASKIYAVLDGARDRRIYGALIGSAQEQCCLYRGDLPWQLALAAPYLVELDSDDKLTNQIIDQGWGNAWGIFLNTTVSMERLRKHLRKFLRVADEHGKPMLFRYYDPRVLRVYLPTCWPEELRTFFGPIDRFVLEGDTREELHQYAFNGQKLVTRAPLTERFA